MNYYEEHERHTTPAQKLLVDEIKGLLAQCLAEVESASKELHSQPDTEQSFVRRWDDTLVGGLRVWKQNFDEGLWRRAVEAVAQLGRMMDYYYTDTVSNSKRIEALARSLTLKAYDLCDIKWDR
ncbi:hypothetical protein [Solimonas flava]|uniref:hypothetical protein n=1 Tax=Solimonas flava TaxID=415849 RepID=UPI0012B677BD|nr:hypothetical protein [Solimonas flava]